MKIAIIGAGGWGTALAKVAAERKHEVTLWTRSDERADELNTSRENITYLPGIRIPTEISITSEGSNIAGNELYMVAVPSQAVREITTGLASNISAGAIVVSASKGIERHTLKRMTEVLAETTDIPSDRLVSLSGPSHAEEVAKQIPTVVISASTNEESARVVQQALLLPYFRLYTSTDLVGVELGGALKNVIAICAGILDGEGFGDNTIAALVTRGLAEMRRLGTALGADDKTFSGVAGLGDLVVTCLSKHSRNRNLGYELGKGRNLYDILGTMKMVAEGVWTTESARELAEKHGVEMPIIEETYKILFENKDYRQATTELMTREAKDERH
ncbi:MAG TPA: NAD(P)H-dependent glycerol-3-phosphate dehydrogenase [Candidatus Kapabacteria bacterium]|nr:NAD(P)H-dependent glycerol-3-phosphate dehydrogenase [Candidatus Kapabacteria bacterium]